MPHVSSQAFLWVENALYHLPSSCYSCLDSVSTEQKNGIYGSRLPRGCQNSACLTTRKEDSWCLHWCERWRRKASNSCLIEPKVRWDRYFMPSWSEVCGARKLPVPQERMTPRIVSCLFFMTFLKPWSCRQVNKVSKERLGNKDYKTVRLKGQFLFQWQKLQSVKMGLQGVIDYSLSWFLGMFMISSPYLLATWRKVMVLLDVKRQ